MPLNTIFTGSRIPSTTLAYIENDVVRTVSTETLFAYGRAVVIGIPGAFTPVCTRRQIPEFVRSAERLTASGYTHLICIAPNDPFVLQAWARQVDPTSQLDFYSDGNLEFARALGLQAHLPLLFLGQRNRRYLMVVADGVIQRMRVEPDIASYDCGQPQDLFGET